MTTDVQTSARFPREVLDRLKSYGMKGETYAEIVQNLMDRVDRQEYIREMVRRARDKKSLIDDKSVRF